MKKHVLFLLLLISLSLSADDYVVSCGPLENPYIEMGRDMIIDLYKSINMDIYVDVTSMERSLSMVRKGLVDAELFRTINLKGKFPEIILLDEPLFFLEVVAFYYGDPLDISNWDSIKDYKVTYVRGVKSIEAGLKKHKHIYISDDIGTAFKLLKNGRVDMVLSGELNGLKVIKNFDLEETPLISEPLFRVSAHHVLHKSNQHLEEILNAEIKLLDSAMYMEKLINNP